MEDELFMNFSRDIFAGVTMAMASLAGVTAVASLLQQAGMDFAASFTAGILLSLAGTLWSAFKNYGVVLTPSLTVSGYLVFIAAISHGLGWQVILGISFSASLLGMVFWHGSRYIPCRGIPPIFPWGIKLALAVFLICLGLKMGRIVIASAWQVTMLGDSADPLMYWSMAGVVLTLALLAGGCSCALFAGMVVTGAVTFLEGFWVIPAAPFFLPEGLDKVMGQLSLSLVDVRDEAFFGVTVLSLLVMLSAIHWSTFTALAKAEAPADGVRFLFALGAAGALCGVPPLVISPASAALQGGRRGRWALGAAAFVFVLALFGEPIIAAIADFPAMLVPVLVGSGFCLLLSVLQHCPWSENAVKRRAEALTVSILVLLLPLSGNFATALGASLIGYGLFMSMAGCFRQVAGMIWLISGVFALYYIYGSMF